MNIFVLSTNPEEAASFHCDQHKHKMLLESAQLLSTALYIKQPDTYRSLLSTKSVYAVAHPAHPCTKWICQSYENMHWVIRLSLALARLRLVTGSPYRHSSESVVRTILSYIPDAPAEQHDPFIFAGPSYIATSRLSLVEKYQEYYRLKELQWGGMKYFCRKRPAFMDAPRALAIPKEYKPFLSSPV
jgi:hypothetical protein